MIRQPAINLKSLRFALYILPLFLVISIKHYKKISRNFNISNVKLVKDDKVLENVDKLFYYPNSQLPNCSFEKESQLMGRLPVFLEAPTFEYLNALYPNIQPGGHFYPNHCNAEQKVAILVPYRNRQSHLRIFLHNIHKTLQKQHIDYAIILIEPINNVTFNRDLIPEDDRNLYQCSKHPRHMSSHINKFDYELPYEYIFGGASAVSTEIFKLVNGYNNMYWGWGMEDDDLYNRIKYNRLQISRYPPEISRYYMIIHEHEIENSLNYCRYAIFKYYKDKMNTEGLNNLNYTLKKIEFYHLYTKIIVDPLEEISKQNLRELGICSTI
ncbi:Beta-1,4-galactosyltransferase family and Galactosyltransferase, C-terminal domain and Galactosyltransferase, N-terminal domain-containing protein [Strongyloides ratti]|uniref:Beta-1,4-N-acetylgalactosaminyltransferase n=1 Tax=Strongyloides ratti TaxID=34506 RepID=A0A090L9F7_STRRB|nr:Beta-1,4-galactosyltransferase family and Galactosyltransferase, C-terminal domain and Galactosyltransferase, N-terminal domain-containing protein [Strongyloides ratti]CEF66382.1 Beta-1,4-galactosyltransferase family and Galactosyltransferase, C-terminal domain and Galactosyltransferase, N-terminal domain-containing protein [Strongyloides ratti]